VILKLQIVQPILDRDYDPKTKLKYIFSIVSLCSATSYFLVKTKTCKSEQCFSRNRSKGDTNPGVYAYRISEETFFIVHRKKYS
jgi:hypothetical protein